MDIKKQDIERYIEISKNQCIEASTGLNKAIDDNDFYTAQVFANTLSIMTARTCLLSDLLSE